MIVKMLIEKSETWPEALAPRIYQMTGVMDAISDILHSQLPRRLVGVIDPCFTTQTRIHVAEHFVRILERHEMALGLLID